VQLLRVRASEQDPLPESFYRGSNSFENHVKLQQNIDVNAPVAVDPGSAGLQYSSLSGSSRGLGDARCSCRFGIGHLEAAGRYALLFQ
jgi:hypothetical protein